MTGYPFEEYRRVALTLAFGSSRPKGENSISFSTTLDYAGKSSDSGPPLIEKGLYKPNRDTFSLEVWDCTIEQLIVFANSKGIVTHAQVRLNLRAYEVATENLPRVTEVVLGNLPNYLADVQVIANSWLGLKVTLRPAALDTLSCQDYVVIPGLEGRLLSVEAKFI